MVGVVRFKFGGKAAAATLDAETRAWTILTGAEGNAAHAVLTLLYGTPDRTPTDRTPADGIPWRRDVLEAAARLGGEADLPAVAPEGGGRVY